MAKVIKCGCGWSVKAETDNELVQNVTGHVAQVHHLQARREVILAQAHTE